MTTMTMDMETTMDLGIKLRDRKENIVLPDEVGIIMGEIGFKSKRELFHAKIGIVADKSGWTDDEFTIKVKELMLSYHPEAIIKVESSPYLDMDDDKPLMSWIYEAHYIMKRSDKTSIQVVNYNKGVKKVYDIEWDDEISKSVENIIKMWRDDIEKAKNTLAEIKILEKKSSNYFTVTDKKLEVENMYNEGESTDAYYRYLHKMKRVKSRDAHIPYFCNDLELQYMKRLLDLDVMLDHLKSVRVRCEYWIINNMRMKGAYVILQDEKTLSKGVYMVTVDGKMCLDVKQFKYRPDIRTLQTKVDSIL